VHLKSQEETFSLCDVESHSKPKLQWPAAIGPRSPPAETLAAPENKGAVAVEDKPKVTRVTRRAV